MLQNHFRNKLSTGNGFALPYYTRVKTCKVSLMVSRLSEMRLLEDLLEIKKSFYEWEFFAQNK